MNREEKDMATLIGAFRDATLTVKGIACVVILAFGGLVTTPAVAAVKQEVKKIQWNTPDDSSAKLSDTLKAVHLLLDSLPVVAPAQTQVRTEAATPSIASSTHAASAQSAAFAAPLSPQAIKALNTARGQLKAYRDQLKTLDRDTLAQFAAVKAHLLQHHLPQVILDRQAKAVATYTARMTALMTELNAADSAPDLTGFQSHVQAMRAQLDQQMRAHPKTHFDPNNLPNRSLKPNLKRKPFTRKQQFTEAGFINNPYIQVASLTNNFDISHLPGADNPAYLAATTEVTLSAAIKAKAAELHYSPVEIYNWVRNNVVWQPTWGAVQDADLTLSAQRGNAFDISSLLIALLRASGIPARYVQGTINVPEAKFRNWIGGFQNLNAAMTYASSGGIPITGIVSGGRITTVQMAHIWVEAAVDYFPSRGARNRSADSWVPLDASYKQYTFKQGLDPVAISGIDTQKLASDFLASGTVDQQNSYIAGLNPAILQTAQQTAQTNVEHYISQHLPNATVGDVLGGRAIVARTARGLSAGLPNPVVTVGARYGTLPSSLEQHIQFALGLDVLGDPINPISFPWPQLNNQQVTLSFRPASAADQQTLQSLLPSGQITDISQLPTSIPAYLINVIPELKVNGTVVLSGDSMTLGQDLTFVFTPQFAGRQSIQKTYTVAAGSYLDVAVVAGNVSPHMLTDVQARVQQTAAILQTQDPTQIGNLTQESLLGDMFQAGVLGYYAQYIALSHVMGQQQHDFHYLAAGIGSFGYEPHVDYTFGIPKAIRGGGAVMNVPIVSVTGSDNQDASKLTNYRLQIGVLSSELEASVPEQLFSTPTQPTQAVSAVTALALANQQGQRIYQITPANKAATLPNIHHNELVMQEIRDALAAGKEVITHTNDITVSGWTGAGYIIVDPVTGDGAYKIGGGQNGGALFPSWASEFLSAALGFVKDVLLAVIDNTILSVLDALVSIYTNVLQIYSSCSGLLFAAAITEIVIFTAVALILPIALGFTLIGALLFGLAMEFVINHLVATEKGLCESLGSG